MERIYSPSDLPHLELSPVVTIAGRLTHVSSSVLTIADAFGTCTIHLETASDNPPALGSWIVASGLLRAPSEAKLWNASLLDEAPGQLSSGGFFARFQRVGKVLAARHVATRATRSFFDAQGFVEVSTPVRVAAPGTDVYLEPQPSGDQWLITSPEFHHKRLLAGGMPRIFELAHCTRQGERGPWHHPEFTMLEWYCAFCPIENLMAQTETLVRHLARALGVGSAIDVNGHRIALDLPFQHITVAEAFRRYAETDNVAQLAATDEDTYFQLMVDKIDPALAQIPVPVFLTHYPESQAALARRSLSSPGFAERFELFIGGVELCNGYGELTDANEQAQRFELDVNRRAAKGSAPLPVDDGLLRALREGVPPCSGNAVGFDRLLAVLLERPLDDVVAFP